MKPEDVMGDVSDVREQFVREVFQGVEQDRMEKAKEALWGVYACERLSRRLSARTGIALMSAPSVGRAK